MKTVTFENNGYQFTVKDDYFQNTTLDDAKTKSVYDLLTSTNIIKYLHNEIGPALVNLTTGEKDYWLNGEKADKDVREKIEHGLNFNNEFKQVLEDNVD